MGLVKWLQEQFHGRPSAPPSKTFKVIHPVAQADPVTTKAPFKPSLTEQKFIDSTQELSSQQQSLLFSQLPCELRTQIWRHVIGGHRIYLCLRQDRLAQAQSPNHAAMRPKKGLLNVPLICRTAYLESIPLLYSTNTFCIGFLVPGTKRVLTQLDHVLPGPHIASLRSLDIAFHLVEGVSSYDDTHPQAWDITCTVCEPDSETQWYRVCAKVKQLTELRSVRVIVTTSGNQRERFRRREGELLAPWKEVGQSRKLRFVLPWKQAEEMVRDSDVGFVVQRTFEERPRYGLSVPLYEP